MELQAFLESKIARDYAEMFPESRELFARASRVMPDGVSSKLRFFMPFPVYAESARGAHKWTVDKVKLVDFWMGHNSLLFGHGHPKIVEAVQKQVDLGTHYAAPHRVELELAEKVCSYVAHVDKVRFVATGSEANLLAARLARSVTGRKLVVKLTGHYHSWYDQWVSGVLPPYNDLSKASSDLIQVCPSYDLAAIEALLPTAAAIFLEPGGGFGGSAPIPEGFLAKLRELTKKHQCLLIFDEMITGFRLARGGAAEFYNVAPDLSTYGKVIFGGMPGAALGGRRELMDELRVGKGSSEHQGTWNGAPTSCAAGSACMDLLSDSSIYPRLSETASRFRGRLNRMFSELGMAGRAYGEGSLLHFILSDRPPEQMTMAEVQANRLQPVRNLFFRCAFLLEGIDLFTFHASSLSLAHSEEDLERTETAFRNVMARYQREFC